MDLITFGRLFYDGDFFSMSTLVQGNVKQMVHIVVKGKTPE